MVKRIVVNGPESTGKSTLCKQLAGAFDTLWVPEYARAFCENIDRPYTLSDLISIAKGQVHAEDQAAREAETLLICDTDLYVIKVWSEHRFGYCPPEILAAIATRPYDLYLLAGIDMPWQPDPLREHGAPEERYYFYKQYQDAMINSSVPWLNIEGKEEERFRVAKAAIMDIF